MHEEYIDAGFRIFGLHGVTNEKCECGNPECKAFYKHPRTSNWQHTPDWSDEQLETMETMGQFKVGFGVLCDGYLIVDIDPRNGGEIGFARLQKDLDLDLKALSGFVVATGGGGHHIYFKLQEKLALVSHHNNYQGIDFKSSGFVVGAGSLHLSQMLYEVESGAPETVNAAPISLLKLLKKPEHTRAEYKGKSIDLTSSDLEEMLSCIDPDMEYPEWSKIGMSIHHGTQGAGLAVWDKWSQRSEKYKGIGDLEYHWHTFGKEANPCTIGTIMHYAEAGGYKQSVTFEANLAYEMPTDEFSVDLSRPPSFVGTIVDWMNSQCRFPRERLAVGGALAAIGNIAGLRYEDESYGVTSNQFIFCVAGSATGKEAIQQAIAQIHKAAGMAVATIGTIKSEQEIIRNLIDHQAAFYVMDEMGLFLKKVENARLKGGAAYLEGVLGLLMSAYSKANSFLPLGGDIRKEAQARLIKDLARLEKMKKDGDAVQDQIDTMKKQIKSLDSGLERPFVSLIGFTTPVTFESLVDYEQAANGFFGRSLVIQEKETNPKAKKRFKSTPMPDEIKNALIRIANGGYADMQEGGRIEQRGERIKIPTDVDALQFLDKLEDEFHEMAEDAKITALEAIPRRAFELVLKVSLTLAIPEGVRTLEHVQWAAAFIRQDIMDKTNLAASNMAEDENKLGEALQRKLLNLLDEKGAMSTGVIYNRCRSRTKEDVDAALLTLENHGYIRHEKTAKSAKWFRVKIS